MTKKLVAFAVASAFALPLVAEAQTATVTMYGRANMDLEFVKASGRGAADGSTSTVTRVSSDSSRFGLRGTESLGGGLTAFFQVENSVNWDGNGAGNANTIANRETFVGLQGSYGQLWLGRALSPYDDVHGPWSSIPLNYDTGIYNTADLWSNTSNGGGNPTSGSYDDRYSNSIRWNSPTLSGFTAEVQVATLENTGHGWAFIPAIFYNHAPIQVGAAYARHDKLRCYNSAGTSYAACGGVPFAGLAAKDDAFTISGSYDFGVVRVAVIYDYLKYQTPTGDLKRNFWSIAGVIPAGVNGTVYVMYANASDGKGGADDATPRINSLAHGSDTGSAQFMIGYRYDLSKRTSLNVGYSQIRNDARATYTFNANGYPVNPGGDPGGFALGIAHNF